MLFELEMNQAASAIVRLPIVVVHAAQIAAFITLLTATALAVSIKMLDITHQHPI